MLAKISNFASQGNLAVAQLATSDQDTFNYISLGLAIGKKLVEISELGEGGNVNTVSLKNNSDNFVFIMDGDILVGAKQNRVVNTSILVSPKSRLKVPVSCIEHGRWRNSSHNFSGSRSSAPVDLRAEKARQVARNLRSHESYSARQDEIRNRVSSYSEEHRVYSQTSNLSDVIDAESGNIDRIVAHLSADASANGMGIFIGKTIKSIDIFNRRDIFREYFAKILRSAAFDSLAYHSKDAAPADSEAGYHVQEALDAFARCESSEPPGVGVGVDRRFESEGMAGFELIYEHSLIHLAAFRSKPLREEGIKVIY